MDWQENQEPWGAKMLDDMTMNVEMNLTSSYLNSEMMVMVYIKLLLPWYQ